MINLFGEGIFTYCFSLNNSDMLKAVNLEFCSIERVFITGIFAKFGFPNLPQSLGIEQNADGGIFNIWISGQIPYD